MKIQVNKNQLVLATLLALAPALVAIPASAQELPPPGTLATKTAQAYRQAARYPEHSRVIAKGEVDPLREKRTSNAVTSGREQDGAVLSVIGQKISYEFPAQPVFYATIEGSKVAALQGDVQTEAGAKAGQIRFFDDGVAPDAKAGDGLYTGRVELFARQRPSLADSYLVEVNATLTSGETKTVVTGFLYSNPHARLTGRYRDAVKNGSLVVEAQVEVSKAGRFHLAGTLATLEGSAIGTAQAGLNLEPGKHWIALEFYGLMFHDRQAEGSFRLASLALSTTTSMPNAWNNLAENVYTTKPVSLETLTSQSFNQPDLIDSANRLEAEAAAALDR